MHSQAFDRSLGQRSCPLWYLGERTKSARERGRANSILFWAPARYQGGWDDTSTVPGHTPLISPGTSTTITSNSSIGGGLSTSGNICNNSVSGSIGGGELTEH